MIIPSSLCVIRTGEGGPRGSLSRRCPSNYPDKLISVAGNVLAGSTTAVSPMRNQGPLPFRIARPELWRGEDWPRSVLLEMFCVWINNISRPARKHSYWAVSKIREILCILCPSSDLPKYLQKLFHSWSSVFSACQTKCSAKQVLKYFKDRLCKIPQLDLLPFQVWFRAWHHARISAHFSTDCLQ